MFETDKLGALWCTFMHDSPMWPIHDHYTCRTCGRHYTVPWAAPALSRTAAKLSPAARMALPLLLAFAALAVAPMRAAVPQVMESSDPAALALARYTANQEHANPWRQETIEIRATLPKSEKMARLRAIRRLLPFGKPEYQVLESAGDDTVRRQVIVRYLSADAQAQEMPSASVAITPANYKFRYRGVVQSRSGAVYVFQITPRQKREGLIQGVLWIDGETGVAARQSGYLVEKPSIFVKRIDLTREITLNNGVAESRVTHVSVDTRLVGRAELVIEERPYSTLGDTASGIAEQ